MTHETTFEAIIAAHPNTDQISDLTSTDNVLTFTWTEMHSFYMTYTINDDGSITEQVDDNKYPHADLAACVKSITDLFEE